MKNIFKLIIPCMAVALALTSCDSTMDDKAAIDAQYENAFSTPSIVSASATAPAYNIVEFTAAVEDANNVAEQGIQFSDVQEFTEEDCVANDTVEANYTITIEGLDEVSTYYARAYAVGKNGKVVYGETLTITTPEAPPTPLEGTYTATEYSYKSNGWAKGDTYKITIAFEEGSTDVVNITNIWDAETTVQGVYDSETHVISVPSKQLIYTDPTYGPLWLMGENDTMTNWAANVTFTFTPRGGAMKSSIWACLITSGNYAGYTYNYDTYLEMQHD